jgi:hypothetical protein
MRKRIKLSLLIQSIIKTKLIQYSENLHLFHDLTLLWTEVKPGYKEMIPYRWMIKIRSSYIKELIQYFNINKDSGRTKSSPATAHDDFELPIGSWSKNQLLFYLSISNMLYGKRIQACCLNK